MTPELQAYYERRLSMMGDPAWQDLMDDLKAMIEATNRLEGIDSEKDLWFRKGELSIMNWLFNLKPISEQTYEDLKADENSA